MKLDRVIAVRTGKTIYRDGNYAIKVFDESYPKSDVLNEALNQARVEEAGLPVPGLIEVTRFDGKWGIVNEYVSGKTLAQLMEENPADFDAYLERFVNIQLSIHAAKSPLLNRLYDKMKRKISETTLDATTRYDLHTRLESMPRHNKICHGDFNPGNIICGDDGKDYVIDWSHATQGNASADVARTYLLFWLAGNMEAAEKYMHLFCKKSDTAKQYVQKWIPIVAASQSVKSHPEEREFLLHWIDVADYE